MNQYEIGAAILEIRSIQDETQKEIAKRFGAKQSTISRILSKERRYEK